MFKVSTVSLSSDARHVGHGLDSEESFEVTAEEFRALLANFLELDAAAVQEADPHLIVTGRAGRFLIRRVGAKLFLYDARDNSVPYAEVSAAELPDLLDTLPPSPSAEVTVSSAPEPAPHRGIALTMLAVGLALNGYTIYSFFYIDDVNSKPAITLIADPAELARQTRLIAGAYATGSQSGDRAIVVDPGGSVRFYELGSRKNISEIADSYRLAHHDGRLCLSTTDSGVVDVLNLDTLVYYRDTYRRVK